MRSGQETFVHSKADMQDPSLPACIAKTDTGLLASLTGRFIETDAPTALSEYLPFGRPDFSSAEIDAVARVMRSGWIGMGPETLAFERDLALHLGVPHVVTVNSCTSALHL